MKRLAVSIVLGSMAVAGHATIWGFAVFDINGGQEVPPTPSLAYGTASFVVNDQTFEVVGSMNVFDFPIANILASHIHRAPAGVNGPIVFDLLGNQVPGSPIIDGNRITYAFRGPLPGGQPVLTDMINGGSYINVHSQQFPGGEIRGQITCTGPVPEPATIAALSLGLIPLLRRKRR